MRIAYRKKVLIKQFAVKYGFYTNLVEDTLNLSLYSTLPPLLPNRIFDNAPGPNRLGISGRKIIFATTFNP